MIFWEVEFYTQSLCVNTPKREKEIERERESPRRRKDLYFYIVLFLFSYILVLFIYRLLELVTARVRKKSAVLNKETKKSSTTLLLQNFDAVKFEG